MDQFPKIVHRGFKKKKEVNFSDEPTIPVDEATEIGDTFEAASVSVSRDTPLKKVAKTPKSKKTRRAPNAFLIFASEQRKNVPSDNKSPGYVSRILGGMWNGMTFEEKEKYLVEARRVGALHKMNNEGYLESASETVKVKRCKSELKSKSVKKKLGKKTRGPTTRKVLRSSISSVTESSKNDAVSEKKEEQIVSVAKHHAVEAAEAPGEPKGEPKPTIDYSSHCYNSGNTPVPVASSSNAMQPPCRCNHSSYRLMDRFADVCAHPPMFGSGMNTPYFGAGLSQSLFPQNPLADSSFWMYRQSFFQYPYNVPSSAFSSPYNVPPAAFSNPYSNLGYPPYFPYSSLYSNSYFADRCCSHSNSSPKPSCSAAYTTADSITNGVSTSMANAAATSMTNITANSMTNATATSLTYATATSITQGDKDEQFDKMDYDSNLLVVDDDEETEVHG